MTRARLAVVGATLLAVLTAMAQLPVDAQQGRTSSSGSALRLTAITSWVDRAAIADGTDDPATGGGSTDEAGADDPDMAATVDVRAAWTNTANTTLEEGRVVVELLDRVERRSELHAVLARAPGGDPPPAVATSVDLRPVRPGERLGIDVTLPADAPELGGVHPVVVSVVRGTTVVDQLRTATVVHTAAVERPGQLAVVASLDGPVGAPGTFDADAWRGQGELGERLRDAAAGPAALSVLVEPALVEDLVDARAEADERTTADAEQGEAASDAEVARAVVARLEGLAADGHELLPRVYASADLAALVAGGERTSELAGELATAGDRRLAALLPGTSFTTSTVVPDGPVTPDVARLAGDRLLLEPSTLAGPLARLPAALGSSAPLDGDLATLLDGLDAKASLPREGTTRLAVALADPVLDATLDGSTPRLLATQRVLAETALAAAAGNDLVTAPATVRGSPDLLSSVVEAVVAAPWVTATTVDEVFRGHATPALPAVALADTVPAVAPERIEAVRDGVDDLVAALSAIPGDDRLVDGEDPNVLFDQLLRATSVDLAGDPRGDAMVADVAERVEAAFGRVRLEVPPVTLTSDRGSIPVTLRRTSGGPLSVLVAVEASSGGLTWPEGRTIRVDLEPGRAQSIPFEAQARSRGEFPVTVRVTDPNGRRELAVTSVAVTSTAISGTALGLVVLLAALLLLLGRARRRRRADDEPSADGLRVVQHETARPQVRT